MDLVHFTSPSGLISLTYNAMDGRFQVKFHKLQAAWGDYIKSIAKSLYYVLTTLKSAGLPFDAPLTPAGMQITATSSEDNTVYVEWPGMHRGIVGAPPQQHPVAHIEPPLPLEQRPLVDNVTLGLGYPEDI